MQKGKEYELIISRRNAARKITNTLRYPSAATI